MNDYANIEKSSGLLKQSYDQGDDAMEALRRRQLAMAARVKAQTTDPKQDD